MTIAALAFVWVAQDPVQIPPSQSPPQVSPPAQIQPLPPVVGPATVAASGGPAIPVPPVPPAPVVINAKVNDLFNLGALQYRVVRVTPGLAAYVLQHDQRAARLTPGFKKDRLVVVDVEVTNPSAMPAAFTGITPALVDAGGEMTNRPQWDVRQQSYVRSTGDSGEAALRFSSYLTPEDTGTYGDTTDAVMVAPGGHVNFSIVFSEPAAARPASLRFDTSQAYSSPAAIGVVSIQ